MRPIDAEELLFNIEGHCHQIYRGEGGNDVDYGMTFYEIKEVIDDIPAIIMWENAETCIPEDEAGSSQDAAKPETARPHICDVLGVDVDEEFSFNSETRRYKRAKVNERGRLVAWDDNGDCWNCVGNHGVCWLINHPDALRKRSKAKLTADEIAICKALGAKWVSMDDEDEGVQLWASRPIQGEDERFENDADYIAGTVNGLFPSVHPGDCIEVPE